MNDLTPATLIRESPDAEPITMANLEDLHRLNMDVSKYDQEAYIIQAAWSKAVMDVQNGVYRKVTECDGHD